MKRFFSRFFILTIFTFIALYLSSSSTVFAQEQITSFDSNTKINLDGTVNIKETIVYDFGTESRHGIFRDITTIKVNKENKKYHLYISDVSVVDQKGLPYTFALTDNNENINIRIGDADKYVTGVNTYIVSYVVSGALTYFDTFDELYWNVSGNDWNVPISKISTKIELPNEVLQLPNEIKAVCYTGAKGSSEQDCDVVVTGNGVDIKTLNPLTSFSGLTVAVNFPNNIVAVLEPTLVKGTPAWIVFLIGTLAVLVSLYLYIYLPIKLLINYIKNYLYVKRNKKVVAAWFDAPKIDKYPLSPAETYGLVYQSISNKQLTSTLIDLAHRGYIKIIANSKRDISLELLKDLSDDTKLKSFEKDLLKVFFNKKESITLTDIKSNKGLVGLLDKFKKNIFTNLFSYNLFSEDLQKIQNKYSLFIFLAFVTFNIPLFLVSLLSLRSAKLSSLGIEKFSEALSLRNFLVSQDDQFNFQAKEQMFFEKLLPYATAFGVEKVWLSKFGDLDIKNPDWYVGDYVYLNTISSSLNKSIASSISSTNSSRGFSSGSSGGFSGGGGGGGGGGSW